MSLRFLFVGLVLVLANGFAKEGTTAALASKKAKAPCIQGAHARLLII